MHCETMSDEPRPVGRPTDYRHEFVEQAEKLCRLGATDAEIADFFGVTERTINRWKHDHPEFCQSLNAGKEDADTRVERSLYQRAVGFEHEAVKIFMPANADAPVYAPYRERIHADVTAALFWLKNRKPEQWRDVSRQERTGPDGGPQEVKHSGSITEVIGRIARLTAREAEARDTDESR